MANGILKAFAVAAMAAASQPQVLSGAAAGRKYHGDCELIQKETLCDTRGEPVRRLTLRVPRDAAANVDTALRQVAVVQALGQKRKYSPTSEPRGLGGTLELVIRVYSGGVVSRWLDEVPIGGQVPMAWPFPAPLREDRHNAGRRLGLIAFGIGITELYRVVVSELANPEVDEVVLLYATRDVEEQQVLRAELEQLAAEERRGRFRLERTLTRECRDGFRSGRVDAAMLTDVFPWSHGNASDVRFLAAGTKQMIEDAYSMLDGLGFDRTNYKLIRDNVAAAATAK